jgi:uncharacterized membrane protein YfcA
MSPLIIVVAKGAVLMLASAAAGAVNAVAGGGTLLVFPTLIWLGLSAIDANATGTVGLTPGSASGAWGYRREVNEARPWLIWLLPSSFLGGVLGAQVLTRTPQEVFDKLVPFLILGATLLFMLSEPIMRRVRRMTGASGTGVNGTQKWLVAGAQFGIAFYGGYFGAGIGILMLASLALLQLGSIHRMNGIKTLCGAVINGVAGGLFIAKGLVHGPQALTMIAGSILGGYFGADTARKLGQKTVRRMVIGVGVISGVALGARQFL